MPRTKKASAPTIETVAVSLADLHPAPWNPRTISDERFQNLRCVVAVTSVEQERREVGDDPRISRMPAVEGLERLLGQSRLAPPRQPLDLRHFPHDRLATELQLLPAAARTQGIGVEGHGDGPGLRA